MNTRTLFLFFRIVLDIVGSLKFSMFLKGHLSLVACQDLSAHWGIWGWPANMPCADTYMPQHYFAWIDFFQPQELDLVNPSSSSFFFLNRTNPHFYLFSICLNPQRVQHHKDFVSNVLSGKVALEFGTNHATISMSSIYLSPDYSGFGRFSTRSYCVVLCFVHISTSLV